jgi:feruloyl esterase
MYHGWSDQRISPLNSINYYKSVQAAMGGAANASNSMRLFMVPGMMHCRGGDGPNSFDAVSLLDQWLEAGKAPDQMLASHSTAGKVDRKRPLCPYPQVAAYKGSGSTDDAANFVCKDSTARAGSSSPGK